MSIFDYVVQGTKLAVGRATYTSSEQISALLVRISNIATVCKLSQAKLSFKQI